MTEARDKAMLPTLFSVIIIDLIGFGIVIPILPFYAKAFDASPAVMGLLLATHAAFQFVFAPIWGRLSDRYGRRPILLFTIAGTCLSLALLGLVGSLAGLFAARVLSGVFGANISVATAYLTDVTDEAERTRYMGLVGASFAIGFTIGPALGGLLDPYGHGVPMLTAAALAAVNWVFALARLKEPERRAAAGTPLEAPTHLALGIADPVVRRLRLANFLFSFAVTQLETTFAYFMIARFDYDARGVAMILVAMAVVMGGIQGGGMRSLAGRFGEKHLLTTGLLVLAAGFLVIPAVGTIPALLGALGICAVGRGIAQPSMISLVSLRASEEDRGLIMGAFQSAASLARVFGPITAGALFGLAEGAPFHLASALLVVTFALSLGVPMPAERAEGASITPPASI